MKNKKVISKMLAAAALGTVAAFPSFGQTNLGASCGCPAVGSRTNVNMTTLPGYNASTGELDLGANLTCENTYFLDARIHVPAGQTIKIAPGTVIKGKSGGTAATETALIIERGGMIDACGTVDCPIVFTAELDNLDGTYSLDNKGKWGGLVILGKATNNLLLAKNGPYTTTIPSTGLLAIKDGVGVIEGFASASPKYWFGADIHGTPAEAFNDNDNSGTLRYVSIRFSGAILEVGNEINGLTLGSVGRGTSIDHIEIVSPADDGIEFFGGTVNVKYISVLYGNDDMFDWDLGYTGKAQFLFGLKAPVTGFSTDSDNGFEADADDNKSDYTPRSHPVIYNTTFIGNGKATNTAGGDNSALAAINAKEYTEGEIYNSVFANFKRGFNVTNAPGARPGGKDAYANWSAALGTPTLKIKCNTFLQPATTDDFTIGNVLVPAGADRTQFTTTDLNVTTTTTIAGFDPALAVTLPSTVTNAPDATPNPALSITGCPTPTADGFFIPAAYRGAFAPTGKNWLSDWTYSAFIKTVEGTQPCPTDLNQDGSTTNTDLGQLLLEFGKTCK
jgi:hypothetical protein